ncbi:hypothetical protein W59_01134 [Rhodococcus opacus RKJ300 = JCM 13270]|uniref:Uncharacterized protein n=1 Tax=Rhodococcus opacus RKJ300 = JCM 13270 TaxID=1165867 RepID=I0WZH5_RHOOP|nr:hypothetical protein W59_01134 [Rhodococcus opacus RKJ300 = JCM 13270]
MLSTPKAENPQSTSDTTTFLAQLRAVLDLTNTELQIAETRTTQARTEAN